MKTLKNVGIFTEPEGLSVLYSNNRTKQIQKQKQSAIKGLIFS